MGQISVVILLLGLVLTPFVDANCPICGGGHTDLEQRVNDVRELSVQWLAGQQKVDGSWPSLNTQNVILGLQLSNTSWLANQEAGIMELTTSRLEYELMTYLLPWRTRCRAPPSNLGLTAGRLAQYLLALRATCTSTEEFYGHDLHILMQRFFYANDSFSNLFAYSLGILSQCSNNVTISRRALVRLANGDSRKDPCASRFAGESGHSIDILSLQVMAMVCARDQAMDSNIRNWDTIFQARVQCIIGDQYAAGTFDNAITTALAVQALTAANVDHGSWRCVDAVEWLLTNHTGGNFDGVAPTAQIIPFLNCNNFGSLRTIEVDCPLAEAEPIPRPIQAVDDTVTFDIQVKVNDEDDVQSYTVDILEGENLYFGMIRLAGTNNGFTFQTSDSSFGQSIEAINGIAKDADASLYWTIRIGDEGTSAPKGIEGLFPGEEELYIFVLTDFS